MRLERSDNSESDEDGVIRWTLIMAATVMPRIQRLQSKTRKERASRNSRTRETMKVKRTRKLSLLATMSM